MSAKQVDDLSLYFLTFNCARNPVDVDRLADHLFDALPLSLTDTSSAVKAPEIIALSLQEIAPIAYAFLGGTFLVPYFARFQQAVEHAVAQRWEDTAQYVNVVADNVGMTALMVWVRTDIAERISSTTTAGVGLGLQEMGNKGAVGARLSYTTQLPEDTMDLTLIAAHLAPMEDAVNRRNEDWRNIVERLVFGRSQSPSPIAVDQRAETGDDSETAGLLHGSATSDTQEDLQGIFNPTGYVFLAGDLNYRTADASPRNDDATRFFPQAQADPTSESHYTHLLKGDQLTREMRESRVFQGLSEAPITFPPTYKYTSAAQQAARHGPRDDTPEEWLWTKTRWPSWCDRVLYLEAPPGLDPTVARVRPLRYTALPLFPTSDHRAVALSVSVPVRTTRRRSLGEDEDATRRFAAAVPIDPEWERRRATARTKELVVGGVAYLGWTWEGNGMLVASVVGVLGAWLVLRSLLYG